MTKKCLYLTLLFSVFPNAFKQLICIKIISKFDWRSQIFDFMTIGGQNIDILVKNAKIRPFFAIFGQNRPFFLFLTIFWIFHPL